jgi:hypothetical protein
MVIYKSYLEMLNGNEAPAFDIHNLAPLLKAFPVEIITTVFTNERSTLLIIKDMSNFVPSNLDQQSGRSKNASGKNDAIIGNISKSKVASHITPDDIDIGELPSLEFKLAKQISFFFSNHVATSIITCAIPNRTH